MKILILNGSPHLDGSTSDMARAFAEGAKEAGHEVVSVNVAHKQIRQCAFLHCLKEAGCIY